MWCFVVHLSRSNMGRYMWLHRRVWNLIYQSLPKQLPFSEGLYVYVYYRLYRENYFMVIWQPANKWDFLLTSWLWHPSQKSTFVIDIAGDRSSLQTDPLLGPYHGESKPSKAINSHAAITMEMKWIKQCQPLIWTNLEKIYTEINLVFWILRWY